MPRQTNDFPKAFPFFLRLGHATDVIFSEAQLGLVFGALQRFSIELAPLLPCYDPNATANGCVFDARAAQRAIDFFHECLTFTTGEWRGRPFVLQPWQAAVFSKLPDRKPERTLLFSPPRQSFPRVV